MMNKFNIYYAIQLCVSLLLFTGKLANAQCVTTITTFPYAEDFETSQGGWASGGTYNDWAWGAPTKAVITHAGSGTKCWITGGLTASFYNYGERSYVTSPCFDFSTLQYPMIDFLIFWDSEHTWDGMTLQSSINGGTTWENVGAYGDSVNCENQNWYNTPTCTGESGLVTVENAWTGNNKATNGSCQGGFGSLTWVNAKHCLTGLGGQSSVMFRFAFGAGTTCNDFDGIAFDSVGIGESPVITDSFSTTCLGDRKVSFTGLTSECPNSFAWNFGDPASGASNTSTTQNPSHTFSGPGSYSVTFTASGPCNAPATYTAIVNILSVTDSVHGIACFGQNNGTIDLTVTGGVTPYTYDWSNGATTQNLNGLSGGTYVVTVSDPHGCSIVDTMTIIQPTALHVTDSVINATCSGGGSITLSVTGGTPAYAYNWGGGITSQNRTGLGSGTYTVTITDANGCTATAQAAVTTASSLTVTATPTNVLCLGAANGSITVTDTGGTPGYTYNWGGGITTQNRTGLSAGTYTVTVTDRVGCTATATATITQPVTGVSVSLVTTNATCSVGGTITTTATGGAGGYTYNWGAGVTTQNRTGLGAGTYTITVTDLNGCTGTASATISSASTIQINAAPTGVSCNGGNNGSINVTATGGSGGYTYNWGAGITTQNRSGLSPGVYSITVTDNSNCTASANVTVSQPAVVAANAVPDDIQCYGEMNGSIGLLTTGGTAPYTYNWGNGITTQDRSGLGLGTYTVTITDSKGCTGTASAVITQPQQLTLTDSVSNVQCAGGSNGVIVLSASGGTPTYYYAWGANVSTNPVISGLSTGTYVVTVSDNNQCTAKITATITQPVALVVNAIPTTTACDSATGTVTTTVSGGAGNYSYNWSNGSTSQNIAALVSNVYSVTVTDANGCTASAVAVVSQTVGPQITLTSTPISCNGALDGSVTSSVTGGTPGYSYIWSDGLNTSSINGLGAGVYTVTVTDAHQCSSQDSYTLANPALLVVSLVATNAKCFGYSDGAISSSVSGGAPGYIYVWSNGDSTADITGLGSDIYTVTVEDQFSCSATSSVSISQPTQLSISVTTDSTSCGLANGSAQASVSGGTAPYTYVWLSSTSDSSSAVGLNTGHYQVTARDSAGCSVLDTFSIGGRNTLIVAPNLGADTFLCPGSNETIVLNAGGYMSYFWQDSSTKQQYYVKDTGTYWVIVTDSNGCKAGDTILVTDQCNTKFVVPSAFTPNGDGLNDVFLPRFIDAPASYWIHIYNRWGALVFESNSVTFGWDGNYHGKPQPVGTFIYYMEYSYTGQPEQKLHGALELLR